MKTLTDHLTQYAAYHMDQRNVATHFLGIPVIVLAVTTLLSRPALDVGGLPLTPALIVAALSSLFYLRLDLRFGLAMVAQARKVAHAQGQAQAEHDQGQRAQQQLGQDGGEGHQETSVLRTAVRAPSGGCAALMPPPRGDGRRARPRPGGAGSRRARPGASSAQTPPRP